MRRLPFFVATSVALTGLLFLPYVLRAQEERSARTRCANAMRQISLGVVQYADDKRFLPHFSAIRAVDGDASTNHATKSMRALVWFGYVDLEGFVCPSSDDYAFPVRGEVRANQRLWFWGGKKGGKNRVPPWRDDLKDPTLESTRELSFAYTRRGYNRNLRSTAILLSDRAVRDGVERGPMAGNHNEGWNLALADASISFQEHSAESAKRMVSVERGGAYLPVRSQLDPAAFKPLKAGAPASTKGWAGYYAREGTTLRVSARSYDRRAGRWSFTASKLDERNKPTTSYHGRVGADGALTGLPGGPFAKFKAVRSGDQLVITTPTGQTETYRTAPAPPEPPKPISRDTRELVALGLLGALRAGNVEAARAFLTREARAKLKKGELEAMTQKAKDGSMDSLRAMHDAFAPRVVRDKDGVVRVNLHVGSATLDKKRPSVAKRRSMAGNETSAIGSLRTVSSAQVLFREGDKDGNGTLEYANSLRALGKTHLISTNLATGVERGYRFKTRGDQFTFVTTASPLEPGKTGKRHFASDHTGVIFYSDQPFKIRSKGPYGVQGGRPLGQ